MFQLGKNRGALHPSCPPLPSMANFLVLSPYKVLDFDQRWMGNKNKTNTKSNLQIKKLHFHIWGPKPPGPNRKRAETSGNQLDSIWTWHGEMHTWGRKVPLPTGDRTWAARLAVQSSTNGATSSSWLENSFPLWAEEFRTLPFQWTEIYKYWYFETNTKMHSTWQM